MGRGPLDADLVLEGGGVKGIVLVGAIGVLEEHGCPFQRDRWHAGGAIGPPQVPRPLAAIDWCHCGTWLHPKQLFQNAAPGRTDAISTIKLRTAFSRPDYALLHSLIYRPFSILGRRQASSKDGY
jgi:hypothetical protein